MITVCALCHRKIHAGKITVYKKYITTLGAIVLHYVDEGGIERFD